MRARLLVASFARRPRQALLLGLAIAVGSGAIAAVASLATRADAAVAAGLASFGPNLIVRPQVGGPQRLAPGGWERVRRVPGVDLASGIARRASGGAPRLFVSADYFRLHPAFALTGSPPSGGAVVLGAAVGGSASGTIDFGSVRVRVAGRVATGTDLDRAIFVDLGDLSLFESETGLDAIEARVDPARIEAVRREIENRISGAEVEPLSRVSASEHRLTQRVEALLGAIAVVAFVLTLLAVAASTAAVIVERGGELALLGALGMTPRRLLGSLTLEFSIVAATGGLGGVLAGELAAGRLAKVLLGEAYRSGLAGVFAAFATALVATLLAVLVTAKRLERVEPARLLAEE